MKKILLTGAGGFVGSRICQQWQGKYELCTLPRGFLRTADEASVRQVIQFEHPDIILHMAAISDTGYCTQHPAEACRSGWQRLPGRSAQSWWRSAPIRSMPV